MKKCILSVILIVAVFCTALFGCKGNTELAINETEQTETQTETQKAESTTEDPLTLNPSLMEIATKYGKLLYPKRWKEQVRTNVVEGEHLKVEMYATVGGHDELHIFDIVFGGEEGFCIGTVKAGEETVYVMLVSLDAQTDDSWTQEEKLTLQAIKEDINYLIDSLNEAN